MAPGGADGMEVTIVVLVVLAVGALYGVGGYLLRDFGQTVLTRDAATLGADLQARQEAALAEARAELDRLRTDVRAATSEGDAHLGRLRERRETAQADLDATVDRAREELARTERARMEAERAAQRLQGQLELAMERAAERSTAVPVVAEPTALASNGVATGLRGRVELERLETLAGLYARLARVETALAQLTTPILLPGEPYEAPDEFPPEALRWDNWKDVGETAYALGEYLTENRLRVARETAADLESGVTVVRIALTRSIYPNVQALPSPEQEATLRAGLETLAETLPRMRGLLETDYRTLTDAPTGDGSDAAAATRG